MSKKEDNLARYNQSFEKFFPEYFFFSFNFAPWRMTIRGNTERPDGLRKRKTAIVPKGIRGETHAIGQSMAERKTTLMVGARKGLRLVKMM